MRMFRLPFSVLVLVLSFVCAFPTVMAFTQLDPRAYSRYYNGQPRKALAIPSLAETRAAGKTTMLLDEAPTASATTHASPHVIRMASFVVYHLYLSLRQDELVVSDEDIPESEKTEEMNRNLAAVKRFGCSPMQYLQNPTKDWKKDQSLVEATAETVIEINESIDQIVPSNLETALLRDAGTLGLVETGIPQFQPSDYGAKTSKALNEDYTLVLDNTSRLSLSDCSPSLTVDANDDTLALTGDALATTNENSSLEIAVSDSNEAEEVETPGNIDPADEVTFRRKTFAKISQSFRTEEFKPAWFAKNTHLQTIMGVIARQNSMYFPSVKVRRGLEEFEWDTRQRMTTEDNDFFDVDWKFADNKDTVGRPSSEVPVVLICHGLESNSISPTVKDMTLAFNKIGMDVGCINFRGCSGEPNLTPMGYHLSFTDDLEQMVKSVSTERPKAPIYLSGFSAGANVVTKFLADQGIDAYNKYNIRGAAVNAIPFNLTKIKPNLNSPCFSKTVYGDRLRNSLVDRIERTYDDYDHPFTLEELNGCKTINEFEDLVLPTRYDFTGVDDYLTKSSVGGVLDKVMVPELVIQALDDPFMQGNVSPANNPDSPLRIQYTEYGGHCGYVFHSEDATTESSWMPRQLARFIDHIHKANNLQDKETDLKGKLSTAGIVPPGVAKLTPSHWRSWATSVTQAFQPKEFKPAWFAKNTHLQTIAGVFSRDQNKYFNPSNLFKETSSALSTFEWDMRQRMETPDGDFFDVDYKFLGSSKGGTLEWDDRPIVLICHGLQSNSESPLARDMARAFNNIGMHAACINYRGCGGEPNRTPVAYHLGFTDDLKLVIEHINSKYPNKRIYLSGFSLGANVVTTYLSEIGDKALDHNVLGAAVNAVPFDMVKANLNLNSDGLTKSLYGDRLLKSMIDRVEESYDTIDFDFTIDKARDCKTIMDMENLVIAPVFGFKDAWDYYKKCSTGNKLDKITVPQYIIQAKDDPFLKGQNNPPNELHQPVRIQYTEHGGHCGYVFHETEDDDVDTSWMPTELARFLDYVDQTSFAENANARCTQMKMGVIEEPLKKEA